MLFYSTIQFEMYTPRGFYLSYTSGKYCVPKPFATACNGPAAHWQVLAQLSTAALCEASHLAWDKHYGHSSKWACGPFVAWPKCFGIYQWIGIYQWLYKLFSGGYLFGLSFCGHFLLLLEVDILWWIWCYISWICYKRMYHIFVDFFYYWSCVGLSSGDFVGLKWRMYLWLDLGWVVILWTYIWWLVLDLL